MQHIRLHQNVAGAGKFLFRKEGPIMVAGETVLNTSTVRVTRPADEPTAWGEVGKFPWHSRIIKNIWYSQEQFPYFMSWFHLFYRSGYELTPTSGQNIFIAGGVGVGKTLLNTIIGDVMGGSAQAQDYLLGKDPFGAELFSAPHWMVDDAVFTASMRTQRVFAETIKKMAANQKHKFHEKFKMPCEVEWQGRIVVTCNADPESIRAIPDLSGSVLDKVMLFRAVEEPTINFPPQHELKEILKQERPYFARALLDWEIPKHCKAANRFGVVSFHEDSLKNTAERSSNSSIFLEILEGWKVSYFIREPKAKYWEGTSVGLFNDMAVDQPQSMRSYDAREVAKELANLMSKGHAIECFDNRGKVRIWRISK